MAAYIDQATTIFNGVTTAMEKGQQLMTGVNQLATLWTVCRDTLDNPGAAKTKALKKCQAESKKEFEKCQNEMKQLQEAADEANKKSEDAVKERLRKQKEENRKVIEALDKTIAAKEEKYNERMEAVRKEHDDKLLELRNESKDVREKAIQQHQEKIEQLEKEHKEEKQKSVEKLESTKKQLQEKIEQIEKEKDAIEKERLESLKEHDENMKILMEANQKNILQIITETNKLKIENSQERLKAIQAENKLKHDAIQERTDHLSKHFKIVETQSVIEQFRPILQQISDSENSLQQIGTLCTSGNPVEVGQLDGDIKIVREGRTLFTNRVERYRQFIMNAQNAHPEVTRTFMGYLPDMNDIMRNSDLIQLTSNLPRAIENGNDEEIQKLGKLAAKHHEKFESLVGTVNGRIDQMHQTHFVEHSVGNNTGAIEN